MSSLLLYVNMFHYTLAIGEHMTSSSAKGHKIEILLTMGSNENPHTAFANLTNDGSALRKFVSRSGNLTATGKYKSLGLQVFAPGQLDISGEPQYPEFQLQAELRQAWRGDQNALRFVHESVESHMKTTWDFRRAKPEVAAEDLWSTICVLFLRDRAAGKTAICANPNCLSPFFLKKRRTQKFCDAGDCVAYAQRQYARKWWDAEGKQQRVAKRRSQ